MSTLIKQFINKVTRLDFYLAVANFLLVFLLIILNNSSVIQLKISDFIFFIILTLLISLYRPAWVFLFFIGAIVLENINLAPKGIGITIRPYQFLGAITFLAFIILYLRKRIKFVLPSFFWADWLVIIFAFSGFLSAFHSSYGDSLKLSVVAVSFVVFYFLTRIFIHSFMDIKKIIPFFLGSSLVILLYGLWQNISFLHRFQGFEVMPGRPNATFTEPDWFGIFIVLLLAVLYSLWFFSSYYNQNENENSGFRNMKTISIFLFLTVSYIDLILTVSRSAWLGAIVTSAIFLGLVLISVGRKLFFQALFLILSTSFLSLGIVMAFHLTNFQLFNRVQSVGSGLQKITISCPMKTDSELKIGLNRKIGNISELAQYGCQKINLENIKREKEAGNFVTEIYRPDPNVDVRSQIYKKSWSEIKSYPIFGIGWGNIGSILGKDGQGNALNSSNIFLEVWLGTGIIGFLSFSIFVFAILFFAIRTFFSRENWHQKTIALFVIISWFSLIIPNLFNAGIFLGFFWVWLGIGVSQIESFRIKSKMN